MTPTAESMAASIEQDVPGFADLVKKVGPKPQ